MDGVLAKGQKFEEMIEEFHGSEISEPVISDENFSISMTMDVTYKGAPRSKNSEICVYGVKDGKINYEEFFYPVQ